MAHVMVHVTKASAIKLLGCICCLDEVNLMDAEHPPHTPTPQMAVSIQEGDQIIVDINGERQTVVKVQRKGTTRVGRQQCPVGCFIGAPYGSLFEVEAGAKNLEKRKRVCETASEDWDKVLDVDRNNSRLQDAGALNQALTAADIARLREEGRTSDEIVAALTQNSSTFQGKTQYSQEKYKRRKRKKYLSKITLIRPTARSVAEFYFTKHPLRTSHLRPDSLSLLLSLANVGAGCRCLVVDHVSGLLTAAVMERMGGVETLVSSYDGVREPPSDIVNIFNFPDAMRRNRLAASLATLQGIIQGASGSAQGEGGQDATNPGKRSRTGDAAASAADAAEPGSAAQPEGPTEATANALPENGAASVVAAPIAEANLVLDGAVGATTASAPQHTPDVADSQSAGIGDAAVESETGAAAFGATAQNEESIGAISLAKAATAAVARERQANAVRKKARIRHLCAQGFQSCIVAAPQSCPTALWTAVQPLLAPSASFAIFDSTVQPLAECMRALQRTGAAVALDLQESWLREYQVLPGRTHPQMATSGTGGYILSGVKVVLAPSDA